MQHFSNNAEHILLTARLDSVHDCLSRCAEGSWAHTYWSGVLFALVRQLSRVHLTRH